jgi:hypothetical protein
MPFNMNDAFIPKFHKKILTNHPVTGVSYRERYS